MSPRRISSKSSAVPRGVRGAASVTPSAGVVLELRPVELHDLVEVGEVEQAMRSRTPERRPAPSANWRRSSIDRDIELLTSTRTTSPKRRRWSSSSTASSRSSASSDSSKSASRVTRNAARSTISMPGKSCGRKCAITCSIGTSRSAAPTVRKRGSASGTFTRAKRSSPVSGSRARTPSESERPEMYGNGCPGLDARAASAPGRRRE